MADAALSRRWARALVELAREDAAVDRIGQDLDTLAQTLDLEGGMLRRALENPGITVTERRGVLDAVLSRLDLHPYVKNFLRLLIDKGRFSALPGIRTEYRSMADELAGRVQATVSSARPLDAAMAEQVRAALRQATGREVIVDFQVDPSLIGGIVAKVGDTVYDASIRARLQAMQKALTEGGAGALGAAGQA